MKGQSQYLHFSKCAFGALRTFLCQKYMNSNNHILLYLIFIFISYDYPNMLCDLHVGLYAEPLQL